MNAPDDLHNGQRRTERIWSRGGRNVKVSTQKTPQYMAIVVNTNYILPIQGGSNTQIYTVEIGLHNVDLGAVRT